MSYMSRIMEQWNQTNQRESDKLIIDGIWYPYIPLQVLKNGSEVIESDNDVKFTIRYDTENDEAKE